MIITANRYHDISCGHRVVGHEGKCASLHGHNYRIHFYCEARKLDSIGRVVDFSVIKEKLCMWLEENWDHRMLIWSEDPILEDLKQIDSSIKVVQFNPTAENIGEYLLRFLGPSKLMGTGVSLVKVEIEETRKCSVTCSMTGGSDAK